MSVQNPQKHNHPDCNDNCTGKRSMKNQNGNFVWFYCPCKCHLRSR